MGSKRRPGGVVLKKNLGGSKESCQKNLGLTTAQSPTLEKAYNGLHV